MLSLAITVFLAGCITTDKQSSGKIKVLILDGYSNHAWQYNTALLRGILEPTGLFDVTVSTTPPPTATNG